MYEESDYIMRQIKAMVRGLGKFMGLEQIKELLQLNEVQQESMSDLELETIIAVSKLELIMANKKISIQDLANELKLNVILITQLLNHELIAAQNQLDMLNNYIEVNYKYL